MHRRMAAADFHNVKRLFFHGMFPDKFGMKSTCDGVSRRCCHDRRVLVTPLLSLMGPFGTAKVICRRDNSVCARRRVWQVSGLQTTREHLQRTIFSPRRTTAGSCEAMHRRRDDRRTRRTSRLQPPGRPEPPAAVSAASIWHTPLFRR